MTPRERQWIVNIQLNQLKCENPFLDDYYYTVFHQKKDILEASEKYNTEDNNREGNERKNNLNKEDAQIPRYNIILELIRETEIIVLRDITKFSFTNFYSSRVKQRLEATLSSDVGIYGDVGATKTQVKRTEEGAQLLLPAESKVTDGTSIAVSINNSGIKT